MKQVKNQDSYPIEEIQFSITPCFWHLELQPIRTIPIRPVCERKYQVHGCGYSYSQNKKYKVKHYKRLVEKDTMFGDAYLDGVNRRVGFATIFTKHGPWLTTTHDRLIKTAYKNTIKSYTFIICKSYYCWKFNLDFTCERLFCFTCECQGIKDEIVERTSEIKSAKDCV